jgi:hypothetical protein
MFTLLAEVEQIHRWRIECFRELGFTRVEAEYLDLADVDLHQMLQLLKSGCSKELAMLILV